MSSPGISSVVNERVGGNPAPAPIFGSTASATVSGGPLPYAPMGVTPASEGCPARLVEIDVAAARDAYPPNEMWMWDLWVRQTPRRRRHLRSFGFSQAVPIRSMTPSRESDLAFDYPPGDQASVADHAGHVFQPGHDASLGGRVTLSPPRGPQASSPHSRLPVVQMRFQALLRDTCQARTRFVGEIIAAGRDRGLWTSGRSRSACPGQSSRRRVQPACATMESSYPPGPSGRCRSGNDDPNVAAGIETTPGRRQSDVGSRWHLRPAPTAARLPRRSPGWGHASIDAITRFTPSGLSPEAGPAPPNCLCRPRR